MTRRSHRDTDDSTKGEKVSLYFPVDLFNEIQAEAEIQERSLSWIMQACWRIARGKIQSYRPPPTGE